MEVLMSYQKENLIGENQSLNLDLILELQEKPPLFAPGVRPFWNDPHISKQMLKFHLDPTTDAASYRPETIDRSVNWLVETLEIGEGTSLLDLGCGPGLYTSRFAKRGLRVTGLDYSSRSIDYARDNALEHDLDITYRYQDYLTLEDEGGYDVATLISGDFCPLSPEKRARLLKAIHRALRVGGTFVLDVSTPELRLDQRGWKSWYAAGSAFWKSGPHLVLEQRFDYPEENVHLDQFIVIEEDGAVSVYRNWFQGFTPETLTAELEGGGFKVKSIWGDLTGTPYKEKSEWFGVLAEKV
jgi:SAM-dependent methyltransferase